MKGKNTLILNQATIQEALQFWLNEQFESSGVEVVSVMENEEDDKLFNVTFTPTGEQQ